MKRVLVLLLFVVIMLFVSSPVLALDLSHHFDIIESPSGWGNGGSSISSVSSGSGSGSVSPSAPPWVIYVAPSNGFNNLTNQVKQTFDSYDVPWWIKVMEVKNHGKASPFYDEVMKNR